MVLIVDEFCHRLNFLQWSTLCIFLVNAVFKYLNIRQLQKGPGKILMGSWKSPGFFVSKKVGTLCW